MKAEAYREAIRICLERGLTFVAYRSGNGVELRVRQEPGLEVFPWNELDNGEDLFLMCPFTPDIANCKGFSAITRWKPDQGLAVLEKALGDQASPSIGTTSISKAEYIRMVNTVRDEMRRGDHEKVVLSRTKELECERSWLTELFMNALTERPEAFICLVNCPEYGLWLGASPEMLLHAEDDQVRVDSIAGTLPIAAAPPIAEQWGKKERNEQEFVTRHVASIFDKLSLKDVSIDGPDVLRAAHVAHLYTRIRASLGGTSLGALARELHPTPAVCGTPKEKALQAIANYEHDPRGSYAGFWGTWRVKGITSLYVNIRCLRLIENRAILHLGGGITAESDPEKEWAETEHKALTWQRPLEAMRAGIS